MKCLRINLTKHLQDLYAENYKILMKEDVNEETYHVHELEDSNNKNASSSQIDTVI